MRFYLPATIADLEQPALPVHRALEFVELPNASREEIEVAGEQVLYEAAFASLELVYNLDAAPLRVVIVAEGERASLDWSNAESIHIDGWTGQALIARLQQTNSQLEADELVAQIDSEPLEWFSPVERWQILSTYSENK